MLENLFTTKMSMNKKKLQSRFTKIHSKNGKFPEFMAMIMTMVLAVTMICATVVMAEMDGWGLKNGVIIVNGKEQAVDIKHIESSQYLHTDSYYVPLRKVFEMLGCNVNYNVPKSNVPDYMKGEQSFPFYAWKGKENLVVDSVTQQIYGATAGANTNMPIIEIVSDNGEKWYCQIGSEKYTNAWAPPVLLIEDTSYISIRAIAYYLIPENEDADYSVLWDDFSCDTYYLGRLTFDEETLTLTIDTNAGAGSSAYKDTLNTILENDALRIMQRIESKKYLVCMVENYTQANAETCISIDKATGKIAQLEAFPLDIAVRLKLSFENEITFVLKQTILNSDELQEIRRYDLSVQQYKEPLKMEYVEWKAQE